MPTDLEQIFKAIDAVNSLDPATAELDGKIWPKEQLYGLRMTGMLNTHWPEASLELQIAARAQHIARYLVSRSKFPAGRTGYLQWRTHLYKFHADKAAEIMQKQNFDPGVIKRVKFLISKKKIMSDKESIILEGVACLVFLNYYYESFIESHTDEMVLSIVQKTWKRMGKEAREIALKIDLNGRAALLMQKALEE